MPDWLWNDTERTESKPSDLSSDDSGTNRLPSSDDSDTSCLVENRYGRSRSRSLGLDGSGEDKAESSDCRGWEVDSGEEEEREGEYCPIGPMK